MSPETRRHVILRPVLIWAELLVLLGATALYAYVPHAPAKTFASLVIGVLKGVVIALFFMQLKAATGLVRMAAIAGLAWASFLYLFALADYFTR